MNETVERSEDQAVDGLEVESGARPRLPKNQNGSTVNVCIKFRSLSNEQLEHLFAAEHHLHQAGIVFDTGGGCKSRDWEFDWSLRGAKVRLSRIQP